MRRERLVRHGDVLLRKLDGLPYGAKFLRQGRLYIPGEDGNTHVLEGIKVFENPAGGPPIVFVPDGEEGSISHREHGKAQIPSGTWGLAMPQKYDSQADSGRAPYLD